MKEMLAIFVSRVIFTAFSSMKTIVFCRASMKPLVVLSLLAAILLSGCSEFKDSVYDNQTKMTRNWNQDFNLPVFNMAMDGSQVIRFALFSDSHSNYQDLDGVINDINASGSLFAIHLGDFTDLGTRDEYEIFHAFLSDLKIPSWIIPGNHDLATTKNKLFKKTYGTENHSIITSFGKLVFWNSNALELRPATADLDFLEEAVTSAVSNQPVFIFQHQDPLNSLTYTEAERARITSILNSHPRVIVFHGHLHRFHQSQVGANALTFQINRVEGRKWAYVEVESNSFRVFYCTKQSCEMVYEGPTF